MAEIALVESLRLRAQDKTGSVYRLTDPPKGAPESDRASIPDTGQFDGFDADRTGCPIQHWSRRPDRGRKDPGYSWWEGWLERSIEAAADPHGCLLILCGERASGKTQIGVELVRASRDGPFGYSWENFATTAAWRYLGTFTHVMDIFLTLRAGYGERGDSEKATIEKLVKPPLLVIDEIHERGGTEFEDRMLRFIINQRYEQQKATVLMGNQRRELLMQALGPSVASRFEQIGTFIECSGVNFRTKK